MVLNPRKSEVFWVAFGASVGGEIQKTRPAVVVSNDTANRDLDRVIVVPLTSNCDRVHLGEVLVSLQGRQHKALANQLSTISKLRLRDRIGRLSEEDFYEVQNAMVYQLDLSE